MSSFRFLCSSLNLVFEIPEHITPEKTFENGTMASHEFNPLPQARFPKERHFCPHLSAAAGRAL